MRTRSEGDLWRTFDVTRPVSVTSLATDHKGNIIARAPRTVTLGMGVVRLRRESNSGLYTNKRLRLAVAEAAIKALIAEQVLIKADRPR